MTTSSFYAKTLYSNKLKALFEIIYANIQTACLKIDSFGISIEHTTTNNTFILINLPASNFDEYVFTFLEPQYVGLGSHVNSFFKGLKNKSEVTMHMVEVKNEFSPMTLDFKVQMKDQNCYSTYSTTIIDAQNFQQTQNQQYDCKPISTTPTTFTQLCKALLKTNSVVVTKEQGKLSFEFELAGVSKRSMQFGGKNVTDTTIYSRTIQSDAIHRLNKLAAFATGDILMFVETGKPILLKTTCELGTIEIYINEQREDE